MISTTIIATAEIKLNLLWEENEFDYKKLNKQKKKKYKEFKKEIQEKLDELIPEYFDGVNVVKVTADFSECKDVIKAYNATDKIEEVYCPVSD